MNRRPIDFCRSWLFVGGPDARPETAAKSGADAVILELEDFTPPAARPAARTAASELLAAWRETGALAAVRINPLSGDGRDDLAAIMAGAPDVVMLPKVGGPSDIRDLDAAILAEEQRLDLAESSTAIVPNIETAAGLFQTREIAAASPRVSACLLASEDMTADLGAPRSREGTEIAFARSWFHAACVAAGVMSIDYPYTFADEAGLWVNSEAAKALGYRAKSLVAPGHAALVNAAFTPGADEVAQARKIVAAFEAARAEGRDRVPLDSYLVEMPSYRNAKALLARAEALATMDKG